MALQHLRSSTANKRPLPAGMGDGQLAINTNLNSPGIFFKDSNGDLVKAGPVHVGATAPNVSPAAGGQTGNTTGELWLDTSLTPNELKTWSGSAWVSATGQEIPVSKLIDGSARQLLQTDAAGTGVEWTSNIDVPGTLDVTGATTLDSTLTVPLGSAAAPTLRFTGDTNTGLYSPGADQVAISTNGTGRLFVDASGNVGVGTATQTAKLELSANNNGVTQNNTLRFIDTDGSFSAGQSPGRIEFVTSDADSPGVTAYIDTYGYTNAASDIVFGTGSGGSATERLRLTYTGRLGLGTSSPSALLQIKGAGNLSTTYNTWSGDFLFVDSTDAAAANGNYGPGITWGALNTSNNRAAGISSVQTSTDSNQVGLAFFTHPSTSASSAISEALRIDHAGNVGIGVTAPGSYNAAADNLVVSDSGNAGITVVSGPSNTGNLFFADDTAGNSTFRGYVQYNHTNNDLVFGTNAAERARIDSSGRLLVGTSSGDGSFSKFQVSGNTAGNSGGNISLSRGAIPTAVNQTLGLISFGDGGGDVYAEVKAQADGTAAAGDAPGRLVFSTTADSASSPTERLRIDSQGRVGIGISSDIAKLNVHLATTSGNLINLSTSNTGTGNTDGTVIGINASSETYFFNRENAAIYFGTNNGEAMRIDSSKRLLVGTSTAISGSNANDNLQLVNSAGSILSVASSDTTISSGTRIGEVEFWGQPGSTWGNFATIGCFGDATAASGDNPGRLVFSTTADGASSPTERMRILNDGVVLTATTSTTVAAGGSGTFGHRISPSGLCLQVASETYAAAAFNRANNDGAVVEIRQEGIVEGTISVSGSTVTLNGAHLSRWSQLVGIDPYDKTARPEILRGTVMSNLDEMCDWTCPTSGDCQDNEQLNKTEISSVDGDPNVAGVFQSWDDDDDTWVNDYYLAMTGDFVIRIAAGTTVQRGDLLCSAGDGTAKPQGDDIVRSKTIAKVTSTAVSCTHPDGTYCVPCVLMAC